MSYAPCQPCAVEDHDSKACENHGRPMIERECSCTCTRPDRPVAPYWTTLATERDQNDQADQHDQADQDDQPDQDDQADQQDQGD